MIASGDQNQFPSSFAPLGDLLKVLMFLSNLNGFNSSPLPLDQEFVNGKVIPRCGRKRALSDSVTLSFSPSCFCFALLVCFALLFLASLVLCIALFNMFLFVYFSIILFYFYFVFHIKIRIKLKNQKNIKTICVCVHWYLCTLDGY